MLTLARATPQSHRGHGGYRNSTGSYHRSGGVATLYSDGHTVARGGAVQRQHRNRRRFCAERTEVVTELSYVQGQVQLDLNGGPKQNISLHVIHSTARLRLLLLPAPRALSALLLLHLLLLFVLARVCVAVAVAATATVAATPRPRSKRLRVHLELRQVGLQVG